MLHFVARSLRPQSASWVMFQFSLWTSLHADCGRVFHSYWTWETRHHLGSGAVEFLRASCRTLPGSTCKFGDSPVFGGLLYLSKKFCPSSWGIWSSAWISFVWVALSVSLRNCSEVQKPARWLPSSVIPWTTYTFLTVGLLTVGLGFPLWSSTPTAA